MTFATEELNLALSALGTLAALGAAIYTWIATQDKDNSQHIKAVETALGNVLAEHASRLDKVETALTYMPSKDDMSELKGDMKALRESQRGVRSELAGMKASVDRMNEYLLNNR